MKSKLKKRNRKRKQKEPLRARAARLLAGTLKTVAFVLIFPALGFTAWFVYGELLTNPYFNVRSVNVSSIKRVTEEEAIRLSGISSGKNIFSIDMKEAAYGIERHPWIEDARVSRKLPDVINIEISERLPVAFIRLDELYVMDRSGVVFKRFALEDQLDLPVITGLDPGGEGADQKLESELLSLIEYLSEKKGFNLNSVSEIHVDPLYGFSIYTLKEGVRLDLGRKGFDERIAAFEKVLRYRGATLDGIESVDLTDERGVVVRFDEKVFKGNRRREA